MANQKIFSEDFCLQIKREIRKDDYSRFHDDKFDYDQENVIKCNYAQPEGLLDRMLSYPKEDLFNPARELFEAYPDLTGIQASYAPFWMYLSLVDLYKYTIGLYPNPQDYDAQYVQKHFLAGKYSAQGLMGMWWSIKMTARKDAEGGIDYTLSEYLLNKHSQLTQSLTESKLFRCKSVAQGVVEYFIENPDDCKRDIINDALKHINMIGSIKQLACLPPQYIKAILIEQVPKIKEALKAKNEAAKNEKEKEKESGVKKLVSKLTGRK